jgi:hypothetical protein
MEAGFIQFDPASEFEIIESIEFEEEIARPESLRFFTLDEQLTDYFDKVIPKKGKVTKFQYNKISKEVDRLREIYEDVITVTDTDYTVDLSRKVVRIPWVHPIYSGVSYTPYSYKEDWIPLFKPGSRSTPNYYNRLIPALPKPYKSTEEGVLFSGTDTLVNEDGEKPIHVLGTYERTKGILHEDGSFTVVKVPMANTADAVNVKGFYIDSRGVEIPNPLSNNPFLASNTASKFLSDEPLSRVFPTIESILTHGVPTTSDPYVEGHKFLKVYDVKFNQIPWDSWKEKFPPVDSISVTPTIQSVQFERLSETVSPSKVLQDIYTLPWMPGIEPRQWLSTQEDGGALVVKMIQSKASKAGLLAPAILGEKAIPALTKSTPDECFTVDTFDDLLNAGVYRSPEWSVVDAAVNKNKPVPLGHCIPTSQLVQERANAIMAGKIAWIETTETDILKEHQQLLKYYQFVEHVEKAVTYEKYSGHGQSELRRQILAVLNDEERDPVDKADGLEKLLRGTIHKESKWVEADESFLLCGHTLALLRGDMEVDKNKFYETWTTIDEGFRSCVSCGEQINKDVLIAQDDFDENGNVIINYDTLGQPTFQGDTHVASFTNQLTKLKGAFILENPGEAILYLLLSLLQVLPNEAQLLPIVQNIRDLTGLLKANKKIEKSAKERTEGILGIAGIVVLLQTHNPFLIPRRSFGSKILKLTGFPRDTEDPTVSPVLDIVISVLKTTFESSPNTFKGPITTLLRLIISKPKDVRKESVVFLKQAAQKFKTQFNSAKERYEVPSEALAVEQISLPVLRIENQVFSPSEVTTHEERPAMCTIPMPKTYLTGRLPPNIVQDPVELYPATISKNAEYIVSSPDKIPKVVFTESDIRRRAGLGFPKGLKIDKIETFVRSDTDGIALLSLLNRVLDILSREGYPIDRITVYRRGSTYLQTNLMRDAARGLLFELFQELSEHKNKTALISAIQTASQRDLVLSMILITKEQATKQESDLRTREREVFKLRMREMNDTEREVTKMLLDIGIAPYIITNEDREIFAREYRLPDPEAEYNAIVNAEDIDRPEEGYNASRDVEDDQAAIVEGVEQQVDYGDYGDRREERQNRDYEMNADFDFDEGYGV